MKHAELTAQKGCLSVLFIHSANKHLLLCQELLSVLEIQLKSKIGLEHNNNNKITEICIAIYSSEQGFINTTSSVSHNTSNELGFTAILIMKKTRDLLQMIF